MAKVLILHFSEGADGGACDTLKLWKKKDCIRKMTEMLKESQHQTVLQLQKHIYNFMVYPFETITVERYKRRKTREVPL